MKNVILTMLICSTYALSIFDYDRAVSAAHDEQWQVAGEQFKKVVTEQSDRPDVLYDAGVVAFQNEDYDQAKAFFESAAQHDNAPRNLKEQAYFNKGNTYVKQQDLKEALLSYEQTLMLNPENEQAKHNHETVKKMLDQQQQQQENKDQNQNKDQDNDSQENNSQQDQSQRDESQEKSSQDQDNQQEQDQQDESQQDEQSSNGGEQDQESSQNDDSQETQRDEEKQSDQSQEGKDDRFDQEGDQQDEEQSRPDKEEQNGQKDDQRDTREDLEKDLQKDEQQEQQEQQSDHDTSSHGTSPDETQNGDQEQDMQDEQKEQELGNQGEEEQPVELDPKLARVLSKREDRDAELNKQLVRALVGQMSGQDGQNCW